MAHNGTTIIIPIYNEAFLLQKEIPRFLRRADTLAGEVEVLLIENGSTDDSPHMVDRLASRHSRAQAIHLPTAAIGTAVRNGVLQAKYDHIVLLSADWLDNDFVTLATHLLATTNVDVVLGSKGMAQSHDARPWYRKVLSWLLISALHVLFGYRGKTVNGIQAFRASTLQPLMLQCRSSEIIESELVLRAHRAGLRIQEVPVKIIEQRPARVGLVRRAFKVLGELMLLRRVLKHTKLRIKIHIDDAGHDAISLTALQQLVAVQRVASTSVLVNMPATQAFAKYWHSLPAAQRPQLFLHFNLVEGRPITAQPQLTNATGDFAGMPRVVWRALTGRLTVADVQREFDAQLAALIALDLPIVGVDSHMHMHTLAPVADVVEKYARHNKLMVRSFRDFRAVTVKGRFKLWLLRLLSQASQLRLHGTPVLPVSWRPRKRWQPFVMGSWEGIRNANVPDNTTIVCHPRIGCDVCEIE